MVRFRKNRVVVKVVVPENADRNIDQAFARVLTDVTGAKIIERIGCWAVVEVPDEIGVLGALRTLERRDDVAFAEPDLAMRSAAFECRSRSVDVNDEYVEGKPEGGLVRRQWGVERIGMPDAWCHETGRRHVLIGLVDSGIAISKPTPEPGELGSGDFLGEYIGHSDLDGSRFIVGRDYVNEDVPFSLPEDMTGHGTAMAGIIAARENNEIGIAGINWKSPVYVCGVVDSNAKASHADVYRAVVEIIDFAAADPSIINTVINLSQVYEGAEDGSAVEELGVGTLDELCEKIVDAGAIMCCASGNHSDLIAAPASKADRFPHNIVAVGATSLASPRGETIWDNSHYGDQMSVVAPGDDVHSLDINNRYDTISGTCPATAHVTGLVSLLWSHDAGLTAEEVVEIIERTAWMPENIRWPDWVEDEGLPDRMLAMRVTEIARHFWGYGRIDAHRALGILDTEVELLTPSITLKDVRDGCTKNAIILLKVSSCVELTFSVATHGDDFGIDTSRIYRHPPENGELFCDIGVFYTATPEQPSAHASVTVTWLETGQRWTVDVSAWSAGDPTPV